MTNVNITINVNQKAQLTKPQKRNKTKQKG